MQQSTSNFMRHAGLGLMLALSLAFSNAAFAIVGKFQFVNGEVLVIDAKGQQRTVKKGDTIDEGDTIAATGNGFAQIKMEDGGFFAVRPDTRFKVDTFKYNGKEDGSEKGLFSLIKGSLRSVTGIIGKKHKENYKIQTATSTIGIRGSGADVGHDDAIGTAVQTLFGGHSLTSGGKTIVTGPGQTALAPPGEEPKFVPNFPFNTDNSGGGQSGDKGANNEGQQNGAEGSGEESAKNEDKPEPPVAANDDVVIPVLTTDGTNFTENKTSGGGTIGESFTLPTGNYMHFITALGGDSGSGFFVAEQSSDGGNTYSASNYTFDSDRMLTGVANSNLEFGGAGGFSDLGASSLSVVSGSLFDAYHTPDDSIFIGRASNVVVNTTCGVCSGTDTFVSVHSVVALATASAFVQTLTGTTSYTLAGNTSPTDGFGNVGSLNSASLSANFTNQTVGFGVNLSINSKTLDAVASGIAIVAEGFEAKTGAGLTVNCTGANCGGGYQGSVGGGFFGSAAATAAMGYEFFPTSNLSGNFTDYIHGVAAFTAGATPTATPSVAGTVGGGGAAVGIVGGSGFNDFNLVNETSGFSPRHDLSGNVIAWNDFNVTNPDFSFAAGTAAVVQDGADATLGVVWGRWGGGYTANMHNSGVNTVLTPTGGLSFIASSHITSIAELGNFASFTGTGLSGGNTIGTYSLAAGSFPTAVNGVASGAITGASATVNFSSLSITAFSVSGSGGAGPFATWTVSGSGSIANFMSSTGIVVSGGGASGTAVGGFVGTQAQGLISTIGLINSTDKLGGAVYMKR